MSEIIDRLEKALKEHNDDCLLCAFKDTEIIYVLKLLKQQPAAGEYETRTIENTYICPCGNIFVEDDDYDTLGSEIACCPNCGHEEFQTIKSRLDTSEASKTELLEACEIIQTARDEYRETGKDFDYDILDKALDGAIAKATKVEG